MNEHVFGFSDLKTWERALPIFLKYKKLGFEEIFCSSAILNVGEAIAFLESKIKNHVLLPPTNNSTNPTK